MNNTDNKNMLLAIVLSAIVLIGWQFFVGLPQMQRQQEAAKQAEIVKQTTDTKTPAPQPGTATPGTPPVAPVAGAELASRSAALEASPRLPIETDHFFGSINLKGGRLDDLSLVKYRETINKASPNVVVLAPVGTPVHAADHHTYLDNEGPYFADFGWNAAAGTSAKLPGADTLWTAKAGAKLTAQSPVELEWDNGEGLLFHRTISVDDVQMFTIQDKVENKGSAPVKLAPYARIARFGTPTVGGNWILHEGLIGYLGDQHLVQSKYSEIEKDNRHEYDATSGWIGFTDKYWASAIVPDQTVPYKAEMVFKGDATTKAYLTAMTFDERTVAPGASSEISTRLFSGAKEVAIIDKYRASVGGIPGLWPGTDQVNRFDLMIDWGWFSFFTYWLFRLLDRLYEIFGNFGFAILAVTLLLKGVFFPLASRSYASMAKMKKVQPEMAEIKERFADDKMKQQQAMMELYKRERINPLSGCLPMLIQVPVFFALYKVLFVTIEMRQQPFFGWIHDLSAPDPTTLFNLFGLIPWVPPAFLMLGVWPLIMGVTMFMQMQLNPAPPDPVQASIFRWMPLMFTFMLASFPAGLVIYWAWNNTLSIMQQAFIMKKNGAKIELWGNLKSIFVRKKNPKEQAT